MPLNIQSHDSVNEIFDDYPVQVKSQMKRLRQLVIETASENPNVETLKETLKWGEPSYIAKKGSTFRMDWKEKNPKQYAIYFNCNSQIIPTVKALYGDLFQYEKNRAIIFGLDDPVPLTELKDCINMALQYHEVKKLPFLGR